MKKIILLNYLLVLSFIAFGQNKHLNIGYKNNGLCFGNSKKHNGIRINFWDKNVDIYNGISISAYSSAKISNGLGIGLLLTDDIKSNGLRIGGVGVAGKIINGLAIGGLGVGAENKINGVGISGFVMGADTMNGFFISPFGTSNWSTEPIASVNGVSIGTIGVQTKKLIGVAIGMANFADIQKGFMLGFAVNESENCTGVQIGISNKAKNLFGIQIGLWNVANNKKHFKMMPFFNFNFKKK